MKKVLSLILAAAILILSLPAAALPATAASPLPFQDVPPGKWYYESVRYVYEHGLMAGSSSDQFLPDGKLTRGMFVTILGAMDGIRKEDYPGSSFSDVKESKYYAAYVQWASSNQIVAGTGGGRFQPDSPINREQMATILVAYIRAKGLELPPSENQVAAFRDMAQVASYARAGVELMRVTGLISGDQNGRFLPKNTATRAEAAVIFRQLSLAIAAVSPSDPTPTPEPSPTPDLWQDGGPVTLGGGGNQPESYSITDIIVENGQLTVPVCSEEACSLAVDFLTEDGSEALFSMTVPVDPALANEPIFAPLTGTLPEHFLAAAVLRDRDGNDLSNTYTQNRYTQAYEEFSALTPESPEFEGMAVLDFDGDDANNGEQTENFGVLAEGVRQLEAETLVVDTESKSCTFTGLDAPQVGEVLYITGPEGEDAMIKAGSVTQNPDGSVTVTQAEDVSMEDFYVVLKLSAASRDQEMVAGRKEEKPTIQFDVIATDFSGELDMGGKAAVGVEGHANLGATVDVEYSAFTRHYYLDAAIGASFNASVDVALGGKVDGHIPLPFKELRFKIPYVPTAYLEFEPPQLVAEVEAKAGGTFGFSIQTKSGLIYEKGQKPQPYKEKTQDFTLPESKLAFKVSAGIEAQSQLDILFGLLEAGIRLSAKGIISAEETGAQQSSDVLLDPFKNESRHECGLCLEGDFTLEFRADAVIGTDWVFADEDELPTGENEIDGDGEFSVSIAKLTLKLFDFYLSIEHQKNNQGWGVLPQFGYGKCPNYSYRVSVTTKDYQKNPVSGIPVTITGGDEPLKGSSPYQAYLFSGSYSASADFDSGPASKGFEIQDKAQAVELQEFSGRLSGTVTEKGGTGKAISGASIEISKDGAAVASCTSGPDGKYSVENLPLGTYSVKASAADYKDETVEVSFTGSTTALTQNFSLEKKEKTGTLSGQVTDKKTAGNISGAQILLQQDGKTVSSATSNSSGLYTIPDVPAGRYTVKASAEGYEDSAALPVTIVEGQVSTQHFALEPQAQGGTLTGRIMYGYGTGLLGATIQLKRNGEIVKSAVTVDEASYTFENLPAGDYQLTASAAGYASETVTVTIKAGETTTKDFVLQAEPSWMEWDFNEASGTLTVRGGGAMPNYSSKSSKTRAPWYSHRKEITSVVVKKGLASIGDYAFYELANLTSVSLPEGIQSIGRYAFYECDSLPTVYLPASVTAIGDHAFANCDGLTSMVIPEGITRLESSTFAECGSLSQVTLPSTLTYIGKNAFNLCALTEVELPEDLEELDEIAFGWCGQLRSINLPTSLKRIGRSAFSDCVSLNNVVIPESITELENYTFRGCSSLTNITLPSGLTSIGTCLFDDCVSLRSVDIPQSVEEIGTAAFADCNSLTSLVIPEKVTSLSDVIAANCSNLTQVYIPNGVTTLGTGVFSGCVSLTSINLPSALTSIGDTAFQNCTALTAIDVPAQVTSIGEKAFQNCSALSRANLPDGVTKIGKYCFDKCASLTSFKLPNGITTVSDSMFNCCTNLAHVDIPDHVTYIGYAAFNNTGLTSVKLPSSLETLDGFCFSLCNSLTDVVIPEGTIAINRRAFSDCENLRTISFPASIKYIRNGSPIGNCPNMTDVYYGGTEKEWLALGMAKDPNGATVHYGS